jgi:hypothetical protein
MICVIRKTPDHHKDAAKGAHYALLAHTYGLHAQEHAEDAEKSCQ